MRTLWQIAEICVKLYKGSKPTLSDVYVHNSIYSSRNGIEFVVPTSEIEERGRSTVLFSNRYMSSGSVYGLD